MWEKTRAFWTLRWCALLPGNSQSHADLVHAKLVNVPHQKKVSGLILFESLGRLPPIYTLGVGIIDTLTIRSQHFAHDDSDIMIQAIPNPNTIFSPIVWV